MSFKRKMPCLTHIVWVVEVSLGELGQGRRSTDRGHVGGSVEM